MIILVFYEITKSNLILALGIYKANKSNDVTGKGIFRVSKKTLGDATINKKWRKSFCLEENIQDFCTDNVSCCNFKSTSFFPLLCWNAVLSKQTIGACYKLSFWKQVGAYIGDDPHSLHPLRTWDTELRRRGRACPWWAVTHQETGGSVGFSTTGTWACRKLNSQRKTKISFR